MQCYWFGVDRTRWARTTHALRMGREYTEPFEGFGTSDKHEIASLCWFMCCLGESTAGRVYMAQCWHLAAPQRCIKGHSM